jgi:hypothetical protein
VIAAVLTLIGVTFVVLGLCELYERREARLERLNRESWEIYRASRRIHDQTAEALQELFEEARSKANAKSGVSVGRDELGK